jgi:hypothetical protein
MARLYSLTGRWEEEDGDSGALLGVLGDPVTLIEEGTWFDVIKEVEQSASAIMLYHGNYRRKGVGMPILLVMDGGFAERLTRELRSRVKPYRSPEWANYSFTTAGVV